MSAETEKHGVIYKAEKSYPTELILKAPIETAEDFSRLKLRASGALLDYLAAAGAFALCARDQSPLPPREDGYDPSEA